MQSSIVSIENLKCSGCANSIRTGLLNLTGVSSVKIDIQEGQVEIFHTNSIERFEIIKILKKMGYPEQGSVEGVTALLHNAKSFVSCAVGRISEI